jgi:hypothetical protein
MTNELVASDTFVSLDFRRLSRQFLSCTAPGAAALALSALAAAWILHRLPAVPPSAVRAPATASSAAAPRKAVAANPYGALFDPRFFAGPAQFVPTPRPSAGSDPRPASPALAAAIPAPVDAPPVPVPAPAPKQTASAAPFAEGAPVPPPRPVEFALPANSPAAVRHFAQSRGAPPAAAAPQDDRGFFEKLFGAAKPSAPGPTLAYASAETGLFGSSLGGASGPSARYDRFTAVYDVAAHTVYLPDGTRLEAHSGLGDRLDDPSHVNERNRGATPPHVYELEPREQLFHGVRALRLYPIGGGDIFGRAGLLAHTYMLGPNGDSNGCVSFRNYDAFLQAYQNGQVKRLAVVARLD